MAWVERGAAPGALLASHSPSAQGGPMAGPPPGAQGRPPMPGPGAPSGAPSLGGPGGPPAALPRGIGDPVLESGAHPDMAPAKPAAPDRTRPIYPYPYTAQYKGSGSIDEASSFTQGPARPADPALLTWFGASFFSPHYETWCTAQATSINCTSKP